LIFPTGGDGGMITFSAGGEDASTAAISSLDRSTGLTTSTTPPTVPVAVAASVPDLSSIPSSVVQRLVALNSAATIPVESSEKKLEYNTYPASYVPTEALSQSTMAYHQPSCKNHYNI